MDIALFQECTRIEAALVKKQSCAEALAWCGENRGTLKKTKVWTRQLPMSSLYPILIPWTNISQNYLEFSLRLQEYIELCRKKQQTEALAYAQKYLATWQDTHMREIEQAMSLLFFGQGTNVGVYKVSPPPSTAHSLRACAAHLYTCGCLILWLLLSDSMIFRDGKRYVTNSKRHSTQSMGSLLTPSSRSSLQQAYLPSNSQHALPPSRTIRQTGWMS